MDWLQKSRRLISFRLSVDLNIGPVKLIHGPEHAGLGPDWSHGTDGLSAMIQATSTGGPFAAGDMLIDDGFAMDFDGIKVDAKALAVAMLVEGSAVFERPEGSSAIVSCITRPAKDQFVLALLTEDWVDLKIVHLFEAWTSARSGTASWRLRTAHKLAHYEVETLSSGLIPPLPFAEASGMDPRDLAADLGRWFLSTVNPTLDDPVIFDGIDGHPCTIPGDEIGVETGISLQELDRLIVVAAWERTDIPLDAYPLNVLIKSQGRGFEPIVEITGYPMKRRVPPAGIADAARRNPIVGRGYRHEGKIWRRRHFEARLPTRRIAVPRPTAHQSLEALAAKEAREQGRRPETMMTINDRATMTEAMLSLHSKARATFDGIPLLGTAVAHMRVVHDKDGRELMLPPVLSIFDQDGDEFLALADADGSPAGMKALLDLFLLVEGNRPHQGGWMGGAYEKAGAPFASSCLVFSRSGRVRFIALGADLLKNAWLLMRKGPEERQHVLAGICDFFAAEPTGHEVLEAKSTLETDLSFFFTRK